MGDDKKKYSVIAGGAGENRKVNGIAIEVSSSSTTPLHVDVRVFEEDTHLVLTVDPVIRYTEEHPIRLMTRIMETKPRIPGSVVVNDTNWYAVVHDLDAEPVCREEWIDSAYKESLILAEEKAVHRLGLPLLGTVHGQFSAINSLDLLIKNLSIRQFSNLQKIVLLEKGSKVRGLKMILSQTVQK